MLTCCSLETAQPEISVDAGDQRKVVTYKPNPGPVQDVPCNTEVKLMTSTGMVVTIYLDCSKEKRRSPRSDDPSWGNEAEGGETNVTPGWVRPPAPGDPVPY